MKGKTNSVGSEGSANAPPAWWGVFGKTTGTTSPTEQGDGRENGWESGRDAIWNGGCQLRNGLRMGFEMRKRRA